MDDYETRNSARPIDLSRRAFVGGGLALIGATGLPLPAFGAAVRANRARAFVDTVGIVTHPHWGGTIWSSSDWESLFLETGVMHTRGKVGRGTGGKAAVADLQKLFARGVKICATVTDQSNGLNRIGTKTNLDFLANYVGAQNLSGIESANEYSNPSTRPADWAAQLRSYHQWLYDTVRSMPAFNNVPVIAPSIWGRLTWDYAALGNLEPKTDRGCMHYYSAGRRPSIAGSPSSRNSLGGATFYRMADAIREARVLAPTKGLYITEYGHPINGPNSPLSGYIITEAAAAKYLCRGLLDGFSNGVEKMCIYSLIDDVKRSKYHGLLDGSLRRRLTFHAVKNLMGLFADSPTTFSPGSLDYTLSGLNSTIKQQLFQKSDGTFLLTLYQDVDSYDRANKRDAVVAPVSVGLSLTQSASISLYTPSLGAAATKVVSGVNSLIIPVGDHVTVVSIRGGGGILGAAATTSSTSTSNGATTSSTKSTTQDAFEFRVPPQN
jgi:hypothetical protein